MNFENMKLYALVHFGKDGPIHSIDYPKVWSTKAAAIRYRKEISPVKRPIYQIVEFIARGRV